MSLKSIKDSFRNSESTKDNSSDMAMPVEVAPESKRSHRIKNAMKKFAFKHMMVTETVALALGLSAQSCIGMISNYIAQDPTAYQLDPQSQFSVTQNFSPLQTVLGNGEMTKLQDVSIEQQVNAAQYPMGEGESFEHAFILDRASLGKAVTVNVPTLGNCVSVISNVIDVTSKIYAAAPNGLTALELRVIAPDLADDRTSGLVEVCNKSQEKENSVNAPRNGESFVLQISSVEELKAMGLEMDVKTVELAISKS